MYLSLRTPLTGPILSQTNRLIVTVLSMEVIPALSFCGGGWSRQPWMYPVIDHSHLRSWLDGPGSNSVAAEFQFSSVSDLFFFQFSFNSGQLLFWEFELRH